MNTVVSTKRKDWSEPGWLGEGFGLTLSLTWCWKVIRFGSVKTIRMASQAKLVA